jgi:hypothetical protein
MSEKIRIRLHNDPNFKLAEFDTTLCKICTITKQLLFDNFKISILKIASQEIQNYYISEFPEYLNNERLKLSDVDTTKFIFDKQNKNLTYRNNTVHILAIKSDEIKLYCMRQIPEYFLTQGSSPHFRNNFKLADFDTTLFKINKENQTLTYKEVTVNIKDIQSEEIKKYCIENIQSVLKSADDKDICKYIIDTIIYNHLHYSQSVTLNLELFNTIKSSQYKLYILKYVFSKYHELSELSDKNEIFKIFLEYPSFLIDLLMQMISTNNNNMLYILKNKKIPIDQKEYKKLQEYATSLHLFKLTNILTIYESIDFILNE